MGRKAIYKIISIFTISFIALFAITPCFAADEQQVHIETSTKDEPIEPESIKFSQDGDRITKTFRLPLDANTDTIIEEPFPQDNTIYHFESQELVQTGAELICNVTYVKGETADSKVFRLVKPFLLLIIVIGLGLMIGCYIYNYFTVDLNGGKLTLIILEFLFVIGFIGVAMISWDVLGVDNDTIKREVIETVISDSKDPSSFIRKGIFEQEGVYFQFENWKKEELTSQENNIEKENEEYKYTITYTKVSVHEYAYENLSKFIEPLQFIAVIEFVLFILLLLLFYR